VSKKYEAQSGGIGILGVLGVAFVVLKLCGVIAWSWWWVTAPFWGVVALALAILVVASILFVVEELL